MQLSQAFLMSAKRLESPVDTSAFSPADGAQPSQRFEGMFEIRVEAAEGGMQVHRDWFDYALDSSLKVTELPPFRYEFVQDGSDLIPVRRGPQPSTHPHWELMLEPGRVWDEPAATGWSRAALPFALQERNANCTHNGLLTFMFRSSGDISRIAYQVASETCQYLQLDLWGVAPAVYEPGPVHHADAVVAAYRQEVAARLPLKPLQALAADYPGTNPANFDWFPPGEVSTFGYSIDGVHYSGGCNTRYGPYPFCAVLDLPSYSLAKSIFAGTAYMMLAQSAPGAGELKVTDYVPECLEDDRWRDVTLRHLIDMTTGNFESPEPNVDEFASYETDFMGGDTHAQKIGAACTLFPRKAVPGTVFAYHTSDTYIAGTLMHAFFKSLAGADRDIHRDFLVDKLMKPLELSPVTRHTRRTYDDIGQPFAGYGLTLHADDIVRLGRFLAKGDGRLAGEQILEPSELQAALQRRPDDFGIPAGSPDLRYNNGFWAYATDLLGACSDPVWIPTMSGYGGISVVLFPNGSLFYIFSDMGRFEWLKAAVEANKIRNFCEK